MDRFQQGLKARSLRSKENGVRNVPALAIVRSMTGPEPMQRRAVTEGLPARPSRRILNRIIGDNAGGLTAHGND